MRVNVREVRRRLSEILDRVEAGEEIAITRRGRVVSKMVSATPRDRLPSLTQARQRLAMSGTPLSRVVIDERKDNRG